MVDLDSSDEEVDSMPHEEVEVGKSKKQKGNFDMEYELKRPEGTPLSPAEWKQRFLAANVQDIRAGLDATKPYKKCETTGKIIPTQSLQNVYEGVCAYLDCGSEINRKDLTSLSKEIFACCDLLYGISSLLITRIKSFKSDTALANLYLLLKSTPDPKQTGVASYYQMSRPVLRKRGKNKFIGLYEKLWLDLLGSNMSRALLLKVLPFVANNVLQNLREPFRASDFFFKAFDMGSSYSILSLEAIFKLIVNHNFEYPNFYDKVYSLCTPDLFYMDHKQKFIELLDIFLSSTHVPLYICAAFAKRLMQILLLAPLDAQEPVMGLVRNLITRHPSLKQLIHRDIPESRMGDPYKSAEVPSKSNALDSSLWELRTLKRHWHSNVMKRAGFADKAMQQTESFVRFRAPEEYFNIMMNKKFGEEAEADQGEKYARAQEGSDDEEPEPTAKRGKGKFPGKKEAVPIAFTPSKGNYLPENSFNFEYSEYFSV